MPRFLTSLAACLALAACATAADKPAVCDGRHRRPANPNGSVLVAPPASPPKPAAPAKPELSATLSASFQPCGGQA